jgi:hypothetical protein
MPFALGFPTTIAQRPSAGAIITRMTRVPAGSYDLRSADLDHPALTIRGSNITVDFTGVTLRGGAPGADPAARTSRSRTWLPAATKSGSLRGMRKACMSRAPI